jgi:hypothetical protein
MSEDAVCILMYVLMSLTAIYYGLSFYKSLKKVNQHKSVHFVMHLITFWSFHIFNIAYTGYLGWNLTSQSALESRLNVIANTGIFLSGIMLFLAFRAAVRETRGMNK